MKMGVERRVAALVDYKKRMCDGIKTVFICADGREFTTELDPESYLFQYGTVTPDGRKIVQWPHPVEGVDELSLSLYEFVDSLVLGETDFSIEDLESDEI